MNLLKSLWESIHYPAVNSAISLLYSVLNYTHNHVIRNKFSLLNCIRNYITSLCLLWNLISQQIHRWNMDQSVSFRKISSLSCSSWTRWTQNDQSWRSFRRLSLNLYHSFNSKSSFFRFLNIKINLINEVLVLFSNSLYVHLILR